MNAVVILAALLGAGAGLGLVLIVSGLVTRASTTRSGGPELPGRVERRPSWWARWSVRRRPHPTRRLIVCLAAGVVVGVATRWPVAALLAAVAVWVLPDLVGPDRAHARRVARIEAVATWTESLRDVLSAAAGLEQAIAATASTAPAPIRAEVTGLADRMRAGTRLPDALRGFAADLDDPTADLVAAALVMAAERHARHIADLLASLATAAREQAGLRMRIAAGRARIRTSTRVITGITAAMAAGLILFNRAYLHPYDTPTGQLVLAVVGGVFAAGFWWLHRIAQPAEPDRVLALARPERAEGAVS